MDRIHEWLGRLPYIREYRRSLELALELMTFEQRMAFRARRPDTYRKVRKGLPL
jgi:hypothetical protein